MTSVMTCPVYPELNGHVVTLHVKCSSSSIIKLSWETLLPPPATDMNTYLKHTSTIICIQSYCFLEVSYKGFVVLSEGQVDLAKARPYDSAKPNTSLNYTVLPAVHESKSRQVHQI